MADLFWPGDERAGGLLSQQRFLATMLEVEQQWLRALSACGLAPAGAARSLDDCVGTADVEELATAAEASGNPVVPLVRLVRQRLGEGPAATWLHRGLTSQDVVDTALVLCLREAMAAVLADLRAQSMTLAALAERHRATPMAARTLTRPAVPLTFGLKAATWLESVIEAARAVRGAKKRLAVQVGGAAGTLAASAELFRRVGSSDPAAASFALVADFADRIGLPATTPWHSVRGRLTGVADALVTAGDAWGRIASDVALLGRPEVGELAEPAVPGRGGSSTMPHKANPVLSVLLRRHGLAAPALTSALHVAAASYVDERPDGAWHVEWDTLRVLGRRSVVAASQATELLAGLTVHEDRMAEAARRDELLAERRSLDAVIDDRPGGPPYLGAADRIIDQSLSRCADVEGRWMSTPELTTVHLAGALDRPLLVVGPSLGTSVKRLWGEVATLLADDFHVVGWELPGHGGAPLGEPFTIAELARGVRAAVDRVLAHRGEPGGRFAYAGDSVGGAVGLQLVLDRADRIDRVVLVATGARIGTADLWRHRAAHVRGSGTSGLLETAAQRWWAPGFAERAPDVATALLDDLCAVDDEGYAQVCDALGDFDLRNRLRELRRPLLAVAGSADQATPVASLREIAHGVPGARLVELDGIAHLPPVEAPRATASLIRGFLAGASARHAAGMANRRAVLGDAHVDRAIAATSSLTADFQDLITRYAWGEIWDRPGLSRRDRSIAVLTALVAGRHFEELGFHLRAALRNGLTRDEIVEVLLQTAVYVGVPAANTAFGVAARVLDTEV